MTILILGLIIFFAVHLIPMLAVKDRFINKWGKLPYMGIFSVVSAIGLALIIYGKGSAPFVSVWQPMAGSQWIPVILMLPASILIFLSHVPGNIKNTLHHPMLMGVALFSIGHLFANGDLASVLLFGSFFIYSVLTIFRLLKKLGSNKEKSNRPIGKVNRWDAVAVVAGSLIYALLFSFHY